MLICLKPNFLLPFLSLSSYYISSPCSLSLSFSLSYNLSISILLLFSHSLLNFHTYSLCCFLPHALIFSVSPPLSLLYYAFFSLSYTLSFFCDLTLNSSFILSTLCSLSCYYSLHTLYLLTHSLNNCHSSSFTLSFHHSLNFCTYTFYSLFLSLSVILSVSSHSLAPTLSSFLFLPPSLLLFSQLSLKNFLCILHSFCLIVCVSLFLK